MYEIHVTVEGNYDYELEDAILSCGWHYSRIDGDPVLGEGKRHYATTYEGILPTAFRRMEDMAMRLTQKGFIVTRRKIEQVIFDSKWAK